MKKLIIMTLITSTLLGLSHSLQSCRKTKCTDPSKPNCENYDPCYGKKQTSADFIIEEYLGDYEGKQYWVESDSIYGRAGNTQVRFKALNDADSFIWEIGGGIYNTKVVILTWFPENLKTTVKLTAINKNSNKNCFKNDSGIAVSTHSLFVWPNQIEYSPYLKNDSVTNSVPIKGTYKGYYKSNPNVLTIVRLYDSSFKCFSVGSKGVVQFIHNIPNNYVKIEDCSYASSFTGGGELPFGCKIFNDVMPSNSFDVKKDAIRTSGIAFLDKSRKNITIKIKWFNLNTSTLIFRDEFYGKKIN